SSFRVQASKNTSGYSYAQGLSPSNFAMQADITIVNGDGGGGFFFRSESDTKYLYVLIYSDGSYGLADQTHWLTSSSSSAVKAGLNQTNRLAIVVQKHTIYLYINSQFITQVDNNTSSYGSVGPMVTYATKPTDVRFEHLQVF